MIDFAELCQRNPLPRYALAICVRCGTQMVRNQATGTYYRNHADAQCGRQPLRQCPGCGTPLHQRHFVN